MALYILYYICLFNFLLFKKISQILIIDKREIMTDASIKCAMRTRNKTSYRQIISFVSYICVNNRTRPREERKYMVDIFRIAHRETSLDELSQSSFNSRDSPFFGKSIFRRLLCNYIITHNSHCPYINLIINLRVTESFSAIKDLT